jgi:hypothetical protein
MQKRAGEKSLPTRQPRLNKGGQEPLAPELLEIIRALARDAARRDHAAELAGRRDNG